MHWNPQDPTDNRPQAIAGRTVAQSQQEAFKTAIETQRPDIMSAVIQRLFDQSAAINERAAHVANTLCGPTPDVERASPTASNPSLITALWELSAALDRAQYQLERAAKVLS